jgi:hypothetical protein
MPTTSRVLGTHQALEEKRRRDLRAVDQCRYTLLKGREYRDSNGRNIQLEDLYLVDTPHPLRLNAPGGKTFIYYADTTVEGCQKTYDQELTLKVPNGSYTDIVAKGEFKIYMRSFIWVTDILRLS